MMVDDLPAANLLMALVAVLYGFWSQGISRATRVAVPVLDKKQALAKVDRVLFTRCLPLACMAAIVFLPHMVDMLWSGAKALQQTGLAAYAPLDSARTAFSLVVLVGVAIAWHLWRMAWALIRLRRRLKA
ncbi:hypothetical protein LZ023_02580 [Pseudomonas silvicola]|nr:hypothetical protein LZ023_02580 [Pseudomonas silvicola]